MSSQNVFAEKYFYYPKMRVCWQKTESILKTCKDFLNVCHPCQPYQHFHKLVQDLKMWEKISVKTPCVIRLY